MEYKLHALSIFEIGQRKDKEGNPHQEDCIYPSIDNINDSDRLFILCDGMGGHASGEVASQNVCQVISEVIKNANDSVFTDELLKKALTAAYDRLDELDKDESEYKKMGTTLTLLMLHKNGVTIAHIGDSRVYQIRPKTGTIKDIVFKTKDHSLINDLIKVGELKPKDAKNFSHKNIITRAIQPHLEDRHEADIYHTKNIMPGDYFFMCSDGMLEQMDDDNPLCFILNENRTDEEKQEMFRKVTQRNKDNHSAHLIHILDVEPKSEIEEVPSVEKNDENEDDEFLVTPEKNENIFIPIRNKQNKAQRWYYALLGGVTAIAILSSIAYSNETIMNKVHHFFPQKEVVTPSKPSEKKEVKADTVKTDTTNIVKPTNTTQSEAGKITPTPGAAVFKVDDLNRTEKKDNETVIMSDADRVTNALGDKK